jgi:hypothetical protein
VGRSLSRRVLPFDQAREVFLESVGWLQAIAAVADRETMERTDDDNLRGSL